MAENQEQQQEEKLVFNVDTVNVLMGSKNYQERLVGEMLELTLRTQKLAVMLNNYKDGTLEFTPACSYDLLHEQFIYMKNYLSILGERCKVEKIDIRKYIETETPTQENEDNVSEKEQKKTKE